MRFLCAVVLSFVLASPSRCAAEELPTFEDLARKSTAIIDATVVAVSAEGHASLTIHKHISGRDAPNLLVGIALNGTPDRTLKDFLMPKSRYVLFLQMNKLFDAGARFHVRESGGKLEYEYRDWRRAGKTVWMTPSRFAEVLRVARAVRLELSDEVYDPVKATKATIKCFVRNESDQPLVLPSGYSKITDLAGNGIWLRQGIGGGERSNPPKLECENERMIEIAPGKEGLLFELSLDEILLKNPDSSKWRWDWPRRSSPPSSPVFRAQTGNYQDNIDFQVYVNLSGDEEAQRRVFMGLDTRNDPGDIATSNRARLVIDAK
jgi:hypothetical protein